MTKPTTTPKLANVVARYHDRYDLLRDAMARDLLPRLDMANTADAQIVELADSIVNCLRIRRQELTGYPPKEERDSTERTPW
jgi:hypothetical protein